MAVLNGAVVSGDNSRRGVDVAIAALRLELERRESDPSELESVFTERMEAFRSRPTLDGCDGEVSARELNVDARRLVVDDDNRELVLFET